MTTRNNIDKFNNVNATLLSPGSVFHIADVDTVFHSGRLCLFLEQVIKDVIKKYDFLVLHLLEDQTDNVSGSRRHNFKVGLIAGVMMGCRGEKYEANYFIAHSNSRIDTLRCSDISLERYNNLNDISNLINDRIIQNRIVRLRRM